MTFTRLLLPLLLVANQAWAQDAAKPDGDASAKSGSVEEKYRDRVAKDVVDCWVSGSAWS